MSTWKCLACTYVNHNSHLINCEMCMTCKLDGKDIATRQRWDALIASAHEKYQAERKRLLGADSVTSLSAEDREEAETRRRNRPTKCPGCNRPLTANAFEPGCGHWICLDCARDQVDNLFTNPRASPFQAKCASCPMRFGIANCIRVCQASPGDRLKPWKRSSNLATYGDLAQELRRLRSTIPSRVDPVELKTLDQMGYAFTPSDTATPIAQLAKAVSEEVRGLHPPTVQRTQLMRVDGNQPYRYIGERHYLAASNLVAEEIYRRLQAECGLVCHTFTNTTTAAGSSETSTEVEGKETKTSDSTTTPRTRIFHSPDWFTNTRGSLILVPGGGGVQAGVWARSLSVYDSLEVGSMLPFVRYAKDVLGVAVLILNPNENGTSPCDADPEVFSQVKREQEEYLKSRATTTQDDAIDEESPAERWWTGKYPTFDERVALQRAHPAATVVGHETPEVHVKTVFDTFVAPTVKLRRSAIIAHSAGGGLVLKQIASHGFAEQSLRCLILTDSVHTLLENEVTTVGPTMLVDTVNFVKSSLPLGSIPADLYKGIPWVLHSIKKQQPYTKFPDEALAPSETTRATWIAHGTQTTVTTRYGETNVPLIHLGAACVSSGVNDHALTNMASFPLIMSFISHRLNLTSSTE